MQMQSVLTELAVFNLLTEDQEQRDLLYQVCKVSKFPVPDKARGKKATSMSTASGFEQLGQEKLAKVDKMSLVTVQKSANPSFEVLFPTAKDFDKIFNWPVVKYF